MSETEIVTLTGLSLFAAEDIRSNQIPVIGVLVFGIVLLLCRVQAGTGFLSLAFGVLPGMLSLLLSVVSKEQIGMGDGLVLFTLGFGYEIKEIFGILAAALFLSGLWAVGLLVVKRAGRKRKIPFLPFLLAGYIMVLMLGGGR